MSRTTTARPATEPTAGEQQLAGEQASVEALHDPGADAATDREIAAAKRRQAANPTVGSPEWNRQGLVDGLLAERRGFVNRGDDKSVALVDEQLAHAGYVEAHEDGGK